MGRFNATLPVAAVILAGSLVSLQGCSTSIVPASSGSAPASAPAQGTAVTSAALDAAVNRFMTANKIEAGQLAVVKNGKVLFSHAYTNSTDPKYPKTSPGSIMRIASESKAFSYVAGLQVVNDGLVSANAAVFPYLKVTKPLLKSQKPDPNINSITVNELLGTTSGLTGEEPAPDPAGPGPVRTAELGAKNTGPLSIDQFNQYLYGYQLASVPGMEQNLLTNAGYYMIDRVVERAAKKPYWSYIQSRFLTPIGVRDAVLTRTAKSLRHAGEVTYDSTITSPSVLAPRSMAKVPCPYGGNFLFEVIDNAAVAISTQSYAKFIDKYYSPNYTSYSYWTGYMCGTSSYTAFEAGHSTYSFTFNNTVEEFLPSDPFVAQVAKLVKKLYN
jgi:CubicO group peptidase (beta-lactamase class C family)